MAMEERQTQIREGAGLEESRLNVEFIEWLRKWSTPLIVILAVIAAGFFLYRRIEQSRIAHESRAFVEYTQAATGANPSPEALKSIAEEYEGVGSVSEMARLRAADVYMRAVRLGLRLAVNVDPGPNSDLNEDGTPKNLEDLLTPEDRTRYLNEAQALYRRVYDDIAGDVTRALIKIDATFGLAAVAESKGEFDLAQRLYDEIEKLAEARGLTPQRNLAKARRETLSELASPPRLYSLAELPAEPAPPEPEPEPIRLLPPGELDPGSLIGPPAGGETPSEPPASEPAREPTGNEPPPP